MKTKVQMWGNCLGLRIPKPFAMEAHINKDSFVDLSYTDGKLVIEPVRKKKLSLASLLKSINKRNLHKEIDFGKPVGREIW